MILDGRIKKKRLFIIKIILFVTKWDIAVKWLAEIHVFHQRLFIILSNITIDNMIADLYIFSNEAYMYLDLYKDMCDIFFNPFRHSVKS